MTTEVCKPLRRLKSVNPVWTWNRSYQEVYERAKSHKKEDMCMKYNDVRKPLYLESDALGVGLGAALQQVRDNLNCGYEAPATYARPWAIYCYHAKTINRTKIEKYEA